MKYFIIKNNYPLSAEIEIQSRKFFKERGWKESEKFPDYVVVIGGDGTMLEAVQKYNEFLETVTFIPIQAGHLCFYFPNCNKIETIQKIIGENKLIDHTVLFDAIEVTLKNETKIQKLYALNEVKIANIVKPLQCTVKINDVLFELFRGTGLVISTSFGSSGLMKTIGGAIILSDHHLFEFQEIAPVFNLSHRSSKSDTDEIDWNDSSNFHHSLQTPLILDKYQAITLEFSDLSEFAIMNDAVVVTELISNYRKTLTLRLATGKIRMLFACSDFDERIHKLQQAFIF